MTDSRVPRVVFLCVHNAGRSQIAAAFARHHGRERVEVFSGGSDPAAEVNTAAVAAMAEVGIDITGARPQRWTDEIVANADVVVTMGCGDECPSFPGVRYEDWPLSDPAGLPVSEIRPIRDEIRSRVTALLDSLDVLIDVPPSETPMLNRDMPDGGLITERLKKFGELIGAESPLYARICVELADDDTVLEILGDAPYDQPAPNILLAAVQYLLLEGVGAELATHYPSVTGTSSAASGDPVELFGAFCRKERDRLTHIVSSRTVQTNEARRCTALMPAFATIADETDSPLALIEIGASAGLNLLFDRYRYDYGAGVVGGPADSKLLLTTELRSGTLPSIDPLPEVVWRRGIDLHPVRVTDEDAMRWARALLWPEQLDRIRRFETAVGIARSAPPDLIEGDALDLLQQTARSAPDDATLVVFHSFVLNQFSVKARHRLTAVMAEISSTRDVHRVGMDMLTRDRQPPPITHIRYSTGRSEEFTLGRANHHGAWLEWSA